MLSNRCNGNRPRFANVTCDPRASKRSPFFPSLFPTFNLVFFVSILPPALIQPRMHFVQMKPLLPLISSSFSSIAYALLYCTPAAVGLFPLPMPFPRFPTAAFSIMAEDVESGIHRLLSELLWLDTRGPTVSPVEISSVNASFLLLLLRRPLLAETGRESSAVPCVLPSPPTKMLRLRAF